MKTHLCAYSGYKIHPGHGKLFVRSDNKSFRLLDGKSESQFLDKKNPRKIHWTQVYRRMHKKGIVEEIKKRRARKTTKAVRAIVGLSAEALQAKRTQSEDVRKAARDAALREIKEKKKAVSAKKVQEKKAATDKKPAKAEKKKAPKQKAASTKPNNKGR